MGKTYTVGSSFLQWYMDDVTTRVAADSGKRTDGWHIGKIILQGLKDAGDFELRIDAASDKRATARELLERSVSCASALKKAGLGVGDVMVIMAPNHTDVAVPMYAAMYLGIRVACVDILLGVKELVRDFSNCEPNVIFCQSEKLSDIQQALKESKNNATVIAFDKLAFNDLLANGDTKISDFKCNEFDAQHTISFLISTSGSTGLPKLAALTHLNMIIGLPSYFTSFDTFPTPTRLTMVVSSLQWLTGIISYLLAPILRCAFVSSSNETITSDHIHEIIKKYKPTYGIMSPPSAISLIRRATGEQKKNLRCFDIIGMGGSAVTADICREIKEISSETQVITGYAMSETGSLFTNRDASKGLHYKPVGLLKYKLVHPESGNNITEPNVTGELWVQGPPIFKEYYKNPVATKECFSADGWFKTGDLFYMDEHQNYYFVDRLQLLLIYKIYKVSPVELEAVIRAHPSVLDAAVTGLPDLECGDLAVALVVRRTGLQVTEQEIKELVKNSLSGMKQLFGGVYFTEALPLMPNTKVDRIKLKEIAIALDKASNGRERETHLF